MNRYFTAFFLIINISAECQAEQNSDIEVYFQKFNPMLDVEKDPLPFLGKNVFEVAIFNCISVTNGVITKEDILKLLKIARVIKIDESISKSFSEALYPALPTSIQADLGKPKEIVGHVIFFEDLKIGILAMPDEHFHLRSYALKW